MGGWVGRRAGEQEARTNTHTHAHVTSSYAPLLRLLSLVPLCCPFPQVVGLPAEAGTLRGFQWPPELRITRAVSLADAKQMIDARLSSVVRTRVKIAHYASHEAQVCCRCPQLVLVGACVDSEAERLSGLVHASNAPAHSPLDAPRRKHSCCCSRPPNSAGVPRPLAAGGPGGAAGPAWRHMRRAAARAASLVPRDAATAGADAGLTARPDLGSIL